MSKIKIAVSGAAGKMGRKIVALVLGQDDMELVGALDYRGCEFVGEDCGVVAGVGPANVFISSDINEAFKDAQIVIDFSSIEAVLENSKLLPESLKGYIVAVTGMQEDQIARLKDNVDGRVSCIFAPNMSVGVNLLYSLVAKAAASLYAKYDVEIIEKHHNLKKDSPSGTAVKFGQVIAEAQNTSYEKRVKHGRVGLEPRKPEEIGMHAVRCGEIIGEHSIIFAGCSEIIEFKHTALSRDVFANGSLFAARFLAGAPLGWYSMQDVFSLD